MRPIDADALIAYIKKRLRNEMVIAWLCRIIGEAPTVEAEPVRHGRWVMKNTCGPHTGKLHCSACDESPKSLCAERYCPNCGAKMDLPNQ